MPRIETRRWLFVVAVLLAPIGAGLLLTYRLQGGMDAPPSAFLTNAAIGAVVGLLAAIVAYAYYARHDTRRLEVARQLPHAVVVQAQMNSEIRAILQAPLPGSLITVAFDTEGVSFWTGSLQPERVAFFPAREVLSIGVGATVPARSVRAQPTARLAVATTAGDIQFLVERLPSLGSVRYVLNEAEMLRLVESINRTGRASSAVSHTSYIDQRVPGQTAWSAQRVLRGGNLLGVLGMVATVGYAFYEIAARVERGPGIWIFLAYMAVYFLVFRALAGALKRAKARERAAGYTTLNHESFDVQQLHPQTGSVVRPAGSAPLTAQEFRRRLSMS